MNSLTFLGELALRALLLGAAGMLVIAAARLKAAETQHIIWRVVLAGMLAMPVLVFVLPAKPIVPAIPAALFSGQAPASFPPIVRSTAPLPQAAWSRSATTAVPATQTGNVAGLLLIIYGAIALLLLSRTILGVIRAVAMARAASRVDCPEIGSLVYPRPEVRESRDAVIPFTIGFSNPIVVLPKDWRDWESFKLRSVLTHETAHVQRFDWITTIAAAVNRAVFWFNPLCWWLERHLATLAETACDAAAIRSTGDAQRYAVVLLEFARTAARQSFPLAPTMASSSKIGRRLEVLLQGYAPSGFAVTRMGVALIVSAALPVVYAAATLHFAPEVQAVQSAGSPAQCMPCAQRMTQSRELLAEGWHTKPDEAEKLEQQLAANPEDLALRSRLLSYYTQYIIPAPRTTHLLWLIEHHPEADIFEYGSTIVGTEPMLGLIDPADSERARELWLRQAGLFRANVKVLAHAAMALSNSDSHSAVDLIRQARALQPADPQWVDWLAAVYERAVRRSIAGGPLRQMASVSPNGIVWPAFTPALAESETLKSELETSRDSDLVGGTGEDLVYEVSRFKQVGMDPHDLAASVFGTHLLSRAHELDPENPRWKQ